MKKTLLISLLIFITTAASVAAPQKDLSIKGKVLDKSSSEPVGWATVSLMTSDSTIVAGTSCDEKGNYSLSAKEGEYTLSARLIGYKDYSRTIKLSSSLSELEPIMLETDSQMLSAAGITEKVKLVEVKLDKVIMNVSESAFAQSSTALDLMKKAPGVTVDKDGNVKLNGKSVSVWIDGRPSYMDGKSLESLLRSTEGGTIEKFELMEHPSSKYDAAGQGGIINIKTKRNMMKGFSGSVGLGGGGMYFKEINSFPWQQAFRANLSYRTAKTNTFLNISDGIYNTPMYLENNLTIEPTSFFQTGKTNFESMYHNYNVKIGNDWFINEKNTFGVIASIPGSYMTMNSTNCLTEQYVGGELQQKTKSEIKNGPSKNIRHSLNVNYTHIFDAERNSEITGNLDYYHNNSKDINNQTDTTAEKAITRKDMSSSQFYNIYSAKADYQSILWKKFMFESGAKWSLARTDNNSIETQTYIPDRLTDFIFTENIGALYATLAGQIGPKWSFKAGLRGEYTNSLGDWTTTGTSTRREYFDVFPTLFAGFTPNEKWRFNLSYSRRIERPRYGQLNPAKMYIDAKSYTVGNPDILPQYSNELGLNIGLGQNFSLTLAYNNAYNVINQVPSYEPDGTQYLTWGNVGKENIGIASFNIAALPITKWMQWTLNMTGLYINSKSSISDIVRDCWSLNGYTDLTFLLGKDWKIELDGYFMTPITYGAYHIHGNWGSDLGVKKSFLDNKLNLTIRLDDIFRSSRGDVDILDETGMGATTALKQLYYSQKLILDLTWNFGKAQSPTRSRKVGDIEESSRIGGGGGIGKTK